MNRLTSETIQFLRYPLALAIVFQHSYSCISDAKPDISTWSWQIVDYIRMFCSWVAGGPTLCVFGVISGYLFFQHWSMPADTSLPLKWSWKNYGTKVYNRVWSLLVPYIIWNLTAAWVKGFPITWHTFWDQFQWGENVTNAFGQNMFPTIAPADEPLWFIKQLFILSLATPAIYAAIRYARYFTLAAMSSIWFLGYPAWCPSHVLMPWFVIGAYLSIYRMDLIETTRQLWRNWIWIIIAFLWILIPLDGIIFTLIKPIFTAVQCLFFFWSASYIVAYKRWQTPEWLACASVAVYAGHIGLNTLKQSTICVEQWISNTATMPLIMVRYFLTPILCCAIITIVYRLIWPGILSKLLTGKYRPNM